MSVESNVGTTITRAAILQCLAIVSVVTAIIHFAVSGAHFAEYWGFRVVMLGIAWLQLIWAVGLAGMASRPNLTARAAGARIWLALGIVLNTIIVVVYIITRTVGDVIGPDPSDVEPVGFGDAFCTVCEVIAVAVAVGLLARGFSRPVPRRQALGTVVAVAVAAIVLLSLDPPSRLRDSFDFGSRGRFRFWAW